MNTFYKLAFMLSFVTSLHCMQKEQPISQKQKQLNDFGFGHLPGLFVLMERKRPEGFKKIFKLNKPIIRQKQGNTIIFTQYGWTGARVDGHRGSPLIKCNTESGEITGYYECLERTNINEFAEWKEPMKQIDEKSKEKIFKFLENKYKYESESKDWQASL